MSKYDNFENDDILNPETLCKNNKNITLNISGYIYAYIHTYIHTCIHITEADDLICRVNVKQNKKIGKYDN